MSISLHPLVQRARARTDFGALSGALELLESADSIARSAGVYALESLARADENARESVIEILSALVRRRAERALLPTGAFTQARVPGDAQAALAVLGRIERVPDFAPLDLHGIALRGAFLPHAKFAGALLYNCDLDGALLEGADLRGAWLWQTNLNRVNLDGADLRGADLSSARGLRRGQIKTAVCDEKTRLPKLDDDDSTGALWQPR